MTMWLSGDKEADLLLAQRPIALVIGMVLDQQVPFERAFSAPYDLQQRLGRHAHREAVAELEPDVLNEAFTRYRALHRFPGAMAERVQRLCSDRRRRVGREAREDLGDGQDRRRARAAAEGAARLRRAEGEDLRGAARQAARLPAEGLARGDGALRRGGHDDLCRGHLECRDARRRCGRTSATRRRRRSKPRPRELRARRVVALPLHADPEGPPRLRDRVRRRRRRGRPAARQGRTTTACCSRPPCGSASCCRSLGVPFVMNDRCDLALASGADGVHVGQDDLPVARCRELLGDDAIVGLSTHAARELDLALTEHVTYLSAGPIEVTPTKPGRPGDRRGVRRARGASRPRARVRDRRASPRRPSRTSSCVGVRHFVVVRALTEAADPEAAASELPSRSRPPSTGSSPGAERPTRARSLAVPVEPADQRRDHPRVGAQPVARALDDPQLGAASGCRHELPGRLDGDDPVLRAVHDEEPSRRAPARSAAIGSKA